MTTVPYYEKGGACAHIKQTHTRLLCWQTFPRPIFGGEKEDESGGQSAAPAMLRRERKGKWSPSRSH